MASLVEKEEVVSLEVHVSFGWSKKVSLSLFSLYMYICSYFLKFYAFPKFCATCRSELILFEFHCYLLV